MQSELDILRDVSTKLTSLGLEFMLTGSVAMSHYAQPRMTRDIDIVVAISDRDVEHIVQSFELDYYISKEAVIDAVHRRSMFNIIHYESVVKVDFIILTHSDFEETKFSRRRVVDFGSFATSLISREDLILSKLIWAKHSDSEMQRKDVRNLLGPGCDFEYLRYWSEKLGLKDDMEKLSNTNE